MWTRRMQFWQHCRKSLLKNNRRSPSKSEKDKKTIFSSKKYFISKCCYGHVNGNFGNGAEMCSPKKWVRIRDPKKLFCPNFFNERILWTRRKQFWQPCRELLSKIWEIFFVKPGKDNKTIYHLNWFFSQNVAVGTCKAVLATVAKCVPPKTESESETEKNTYLYVFLRKIPTDSNKTVLTTLPESLVQNREMIFVKVWKRLQNYLSFKFVLFSQNVAECTTNAVLLTVLKHFRQKIKKVLV